MIGLKEKLLKGGIALEGLNEKQKMFADEYIKCGNASQAARTAGYKAGYAGSNTAKLLNNTKVRAYLQKRMEEKDKKTVASQDEVLETLTRILRREEKEVVVVVTKTSKSFYDKNGKKQTLTKEEPQLVEIPTKISDVNKAAELLGKRYQLYSDKVKVEGIEQVIFQGCDEIED